MNKPQITHDIASTARVAICFRRQEVLKYWLQDWILYKDGYHKDMYPVTFWSNKLQELNDASAALIMY